LLRLLFSLFLLYLLLLLFAGAVLHVLVAALVIK
jgi:hypothetical protein